MNNDGIDAGMTTDPTVAQLVNSGQAKVLVDMRTEEGTRQALGGLYPSSSLYMRCDFVDAHPEIVQKLATSFVQTLHWITQHSAEQIADKMPPQYASAGKELYAQSVGRLDRHVQRRRADETPSRTERIAHPRSVLEERGPGEGSDRFVCHLYDPVRRNRAARAAAMNRGETDMVNNHGRGPLQGIRVLDISTVYAAPITAMLLGDFGADVVKIEHPAGDPARSHGAHKDGHGLWWKVISRNKRCVTLNLGTPDGQQILRDLVVDADVLVENFRPGVLENWGLGPEQLHGLNPGLIMLRVTGFGQTGPYATRRAFGTLAEAMSGFAHQTGEETGPPTLPPFGLADGVAGITGAFAVVSALYHRDCTGEQRAGQVIDLSLLEPLVGILGPGPSAFDQLGTIAGRHGNRSPNNAPRNTYLTKDGRWVAISASATSVAERVMHLVGRPDLVEEPWFASAGSAPATVTCSMRRSRNGSRPDPSTR